MSNIALTSTTLSGFLETDFQQFKDVIQDGGVNAIVLDVNQTGTTGVGATFRRDLASGSTDDYVVEIINDNAGDDQVVLKVQQDGTQYGIYAAKTLATDITYGVMNADNSSGGGNTSYSILSRYNSTLGTNHFYRHLASAATAGPVMFIHQDNAGDDQDALSIQQDGSGYGINVDQNGDKVALNIASAATTAGNYAIQVISEGGAYTARFATDITNNLATFARAPGNAAGSNWIYRDLASADTGGPVVFIEQDNAGDDQDALAIQQDGSGYAILAQTSSGNDIMRLGASFVSFDQIGSVALPTLILNGDLDTGFWHPAANTIAIATNGTERMRWLSSGVVNCVGEFTAGTKTFQIDHPLDPENKYLFHGCIESDEMRNMYYGQATLVAGKAAIQLPAWFHALNGTDKKEFNYQLTPIGANGNLYISKETENGIFEISGDLDIKVSWILSAIRHDTFAESHRLVVEVEKEQENKGKTIHPIKENENI